MDRSDDPIWQFVHPVVGELLRVHGLTPDRLRGFPVLPRLATLQSAAVGVWLAQHGRSMVQEKHRHTFDAVLGDVVAYLELQRQAGLSERGDPALARRQAYSAGLQEQVLRTHVRRRRPAGMAGLAHAAASIVLANSYSVQQTLRSMAARFGQVVDAEQATDLAVQLEGEVLRQECQAAVDAYCDEPIDVRRVWWRGPQGSSPAGHFLFATDDAVGAVTKLKNRWRVVVGARDDVLATLPDDVFEDAARAAL